MTRIRIGLGCPGGGRFHMHFRRIVNPFGWALYIGPVYVMAVSS